MMRLHPYLAIRGLTRTGMGWAMATVVVVLAANLDLPVQRLDTRGLGTFVEPSAAGPLLLAVPALVAVHTWREPVGDLAVPSGRSLLWPRLLHGGLLALAAAVTGALVAMRIDAFADARLIANAIVLTAAALLSSASFGPAQGWLLPSALLGIQLLPFPLPFTATAWAYDATSPQTALTAALILMATSLAVAVAAAPRSLLGHRSALAAVAANRE